MTHISETIDRHLRQVRRDQSGGGEDLLQPGREPQDRQPAQERVVRGRPQVQADGEPLRGHGENCQG